MSILRFHQVQALLTKPLTDLKDASAPKTPHTATTLDKVGKVPRHIHAVIPARQRPRVITLIGEHRVNLLAAIAILPWHRQEGHQLEAVGIGCTAVVGGCPQGYLLSCCQSRWRNFLSEFRVLLSIQDISFRQAITA